MVTTRATAAGVSRAPAAPPPPRRPLRGRDGRAGGPRRDAAPRRAPRECAASCVGPPGLAFHVAGQPGIDGAPGSPTRQPVAAPQRQPVGRWEHGAQRLRGAPLQHVPGLVVHVPGDGRQGRPFHLPQLDAQQLQEVPVGVGRRRAAALRRGHEPLGDVEPDGALAGRGARGGVDRRDRRRLQDGPHDHGQVVEVPWGEVTVLAQGVEGIALRRGGHRLPVRALAWTANNSVSGSGGLARRGRRSAGLFGP